MSTQCIVAISSHCFQLVPNPAPLLTYCQTTTHMQPWGFRWHSKQNKLKQRANLSFKKLQDKNHPSCPSSSLETKRWGGALPFVLLSGSNFACLESLGELIDICEIQLVGGGAQ